MAGNTKAELLQWLGIKSRSQRWSAIVAYDRLTVNSILLSNYIERLNTNRTFSVSGVERLSSDYIWYAGGVVDSPVASFDTGSVDFLDSKARLSMRVIGGSECLIDFDTKTISRIAKIDPLNGPLLDMIIPLQNVTAEATYVGRVIIDLTQGTDMALSSGITPVESALSAEVFRKAFAALPDEKRIWTVSRMWRNAGPFKIDRFQIRTQRAPGSTVRNAVNYGDGAVVLFVTMEGDSDGAIPGGDFKYLIPGDGAVPYTATVLLSVRKVLEFSESSIFNTSSAVKHALGYTITGEPDIGLHVLSFNSGSFTRLNVASGIGLSSMPTLGGSNGWPASGSTGTRSSLSLEGGKVHFDWEFSNAADTFHLRYPGTTNDTPDYPMTASGSASAEMQFELDAPSQSIELSAPVNTTYRASLTIGSGYPSTEQPPFNGPPGIWPTAAEVKSALERKVPEMGEWFWAHFNRFPTELPTFTLRSLFFSGKNKMRISDIALKHDLVMFGHLGAPVEEFAVLDPRRTLASGAAAKFTVTSGISGVTWSVAKAPGSVGSPGTINSSTGDYTAPQASAFTGERMDAIITATKGTQTALALATVLRKAVSAGPLFQYVMTGSSVELIAGTMLAGPIEWSLRDPASGTLTPSTSKPGGMTFTASAPAEKKVGLKIAEVIVKANGHQASAYIGVIQFGSNFVVSHSINQGMGTVQLAALIEDEEEEAEWKILHGTGTITNGLLRVTNNESGFVTVRAQILSNMFAWQTFPLPLAAFPPKPSASAAAPLLLGD